MSHGTLRAGTKSSITLAFALAAGGIWGTTPRASAAITFMHQYSTIDASWVSDAEITPRSGIFSAAGHNDSIITPPAPDGHGVYQVPLTGRVQSATGNGTYYSGANARIDNNTTISYNGDLTIGNPDPATRTFSISVAHDILFSLTDSSYYWTRLNLDQNLGPWSRCEITGPTTIDLTTIGNGVDVLLAPGLYRFRAEFSNTFSANSGFLLGNVANFVLSVPTPGSACMIAIGGVFACRRRRD